jgi:hypothetical protein
MMPDLLPWNFQTGCQSCTCSPPSTSSPQVDCLNTENGKGLNSARCFKNFYGRKLRLFKVSYNICPWQAFPA